MRVDRSSLALGAAALVAYAALAPTHVVDGDNAELAALAELGGRAHPSGYPVYVLWLRAWSWLPAASPAHAASLATAILAAVAVAVLHAACRAWGARPGPAAIAVAIVAASPLVLAIHTEAEVFALNALVVAAVLWLAADAGPLRGVRRAAALGLVAGLGLSNHLTCALVAPVGLVGVYHAVREGGAISILAAVGGLVVGLSPYAYVVLAPDTPASWGAGDLVDHVLRRAYGGPTAFAASGEATPATHVASELAAIARAWLWIPFAAGVAMLGWRAVRARGAWLALAVSWLIAGPVLAARFNLPVDGLGRHMVQRFYLLPALLLAVPVACAIDALVARVPRLDGRAAVAAAIAGFVVLAIAGAPRVRAEHSAAMQHGVENILNALPPNSVLIVHHDDLALGSIYVQCVAGVRPDVDVIAWPMMTLPWYRERMAARGLRVPDGDDLASVRLAGALLAAGRPVFADTFEAHVARALPSYPFAGVVRVLPRGAKPPSLEAVVDENRTAFAAFDLDDPRPGPDDGYPTVAYLRYAETWSRLADALAAAGRSADAAAAATLAHDLAPE